ncbi:MAG: outer membrane beta-barrel protein [Bacteroidales bacterium]|nr:outer membrane beta-barrel protein [Bacteroidales bacterium]
MKKTIYAAILLLLSAGEAMGQRNDDSAMRWSLGAGLRVGMGTMKQETSGVSSDAGKGIDGAAEGIFTIYFAKKWQGPSLGIRTGVTAGYKQNSLSMPIDLEYPATDSEGNKLTYHVTADKVKETDRQLSAEVPVMCAAYYKNFVVNLGVKVGFPVMSRYEQKMSNPQLTATYDDLGVSISGEKVTGVIATDDNHTKAKLEAANFNLCAALEAGYELPFKVLGGKIQVGVYVDYGLIDNFDAKGDKFTEADPSKIDGDTNTPTLVVVRTLTDSYVSNVGIFDVGLRGVYVFERKKAKDNGSSRRKSNNVRNRWH